jgi:Uma2 family endonuclease
MSVLTEIPAKSRINPDFTSNGMISQRLITAAEYQRMIELGIFQEDERIELIEGRIVQMSPKNLKHAIATKRANRWLGKLLGDRAIIGVQDPILLNDFSEPEPDIVLIAPPDERYIENHPTPKDIFLVLEIADTSLIYDRDEKGPLFAQNGIVQYCLLNLQSRELEDYRQPSPNGYRSKRTYTEEQSFNLVSFPKVSIKVKDLLPPVETKPKRTKK